MAKRTFRLPVDRRNDPTAGRLFPRFGEGDTIFPTKSGHQVPSPRNLHLEKGSGVFSKRLPTPVPVPVVTRAHPETGVDLTYVKLAGESDGTAGDKYTGLDAFGRVVDQRWTTSG